MDWKNDARRERVNDPVRLAKTNELAAARLSCVCYRPAQVSFPPVPPWLMKGEVAARGDEAERFFG